MLLALVVTCGLLLCGLIPHCLFSFHCRQMFSHYSNMYPQLIKDEKVLEPLKNFLRYSVKLYQIKAMD